MNALILAAGYATRLYPITINKAKPLLKIANKPIIEWILDNLVSIPYLEKVYVVVNEKFSKAFQVWSESYIQCCQPSLSLRVVNNGSLSDKDRRGAVGDMHYVIQNEKIACSDLLVVAGDNFFIQPLDKFADFAKAHPATLAVRTVSNCEEARRYSSVITDVIGRLIHFEEKPKQAVSKYIGTALYYYRKDTLSLVNTYIQEGNDPDHPGCLIQWLYPRVEVRTWLLSGTWLDIGSKESLEEANLF